jgi:hypothetical protein
MLTIGEASCFKKRKRIVFEVGMQRTHDSNNSQAARRMVSRGVRRNVMLAQHRLGQVNRGRNLDREDGYDQGQRNRER